LAETLHKVSIKGTPKKIHAAPTEQAGLAGWWTEQVKAQAKVGTVAKFRFGKAGRNEMQILELVPKRLVPWRCRVNTFGDEWVNTEIFFELERDKEQTIVRFNHRRWLQESDFLGFCSLKWATFLLSLKNPIEHGKGAPAPNDIET
jgi:uncharacterized protein YndB with AHSA1/START domain